MPRTYVDNAYNRSADRVGMTHGTAVISSSGGGGGYSSYQSSSGIGGGSSSYHSPSYNASSSSGSYVDNSYNRSVGRVGLPVGSAVISSSGSNSSRNYSAISESSSTSRTYVDNSNNRQAGRVGLPVGSAVISSSGTNRGSPSRMHSENYSVFSDSPSMASILNTSYQHASGAAPKQKVYVDNIVNRRLGRVGLPHDSASSSGSSVSTLSGCYVDNKVNRSLGRVGLPLGSSPLSKNSSKSGPMRSNSYSETVQKNNDDIYRHNLFKHLSCNPDEDLDTERYNSDVREDVQSAAIDMVLDYFSRVMEVRQWQQESRRTDEPKTAKALLEDFSGTIYKYEDVELGGIIGRGSFADVHFAKYKGSVMAVKKLRVQRVSKKRLQAFTDELSVLCKLNHCNIVRFIGACVATPNLCICMEYMDKSLYQALHMEWVKYSEDEKRSMVTGIASGLKYLHEQGVAHCDIKSANVLLDNKSDVSEVVAKLTDFGLSMMKNDAETSTSSAEEVRGNLGTPRYSAPEVLRGDLLNVEHWMKADIYSLALVVYEILLEMEPFDSLSQLQLIKQVGGKNLLPEIPDDANVLPSVVNFLRECWDGKSSDRPTSRKLHSFFENAGDLYVL